MSDAVEAAVEVTADAVEDTGEIVAEMVRGLNTIKIQYATLGAACGLAAGALIGFKVAFKKAELKFQALADEEIEIMKQHYAEKATAQQGKPDLEEVVQDLGYAPQKDEIILDLKRTNYSDKPAEPPAPQVEVKVQNVFADHSGEDFKGLSTEVWNHDAELAKRDHTKPHIIHKQEFAEGEYENATLTYYVQDDVLADERDRQMDDADSTVGLENLEKFGHGSEDANVVYVRNPRLEVDFEVLRSGGSYSEEVVGFSDDDSLQHSAMRRRRPRWDEVE